MLVCVSEVVCMDSGLCIRMKHVKLDGWTVVVGGVGCRSVVGVWVSVAVAVVGGWVGWWCGLFGGIMGVLGIARVYMKDREGSGWLVGL